MQCKGETHVFGDSGDFCQCGVIPQKHAELTLFEKLERMEKSALLRGMLTVEEVKELQACRVRRIEPTLVSQLWQELFLFYLPRCYDTAIEAPTDKERLRIRVLAAVRMANDAMEVVWDNRR